MNIYQEGIPARPDCQLSWYVFVYSRCLERQSRLFLWTSGRCRECVQIAEGRRQIEEEEEGSFLQPEHLALKGGDSAAVRRGGREDLSWSREGERHTERGVCAVWMYSAAFAL